MEKKNTKEFIANKVSGMEASLFTISVLQDVIMINEIKNKFKFGLYGITMDLDKSKADEWAILDNFKAESGKVVDFINKHGTGYFKNIANKIKKDSEILRKESIKLTSKMPLFNDKELVKNYEEFMNTYNDFYGLGAITFIYESSLSEKLASSLSSKYHGAVDILTKLLKTSYKSFMIENEDLLNRIGETKNKKVRTALIKNYIKNFFFIDTNYKTSSLMDDKRVINKIENITVRHKKIIESKRLVDLDKIKLSKEEKNIIELLKISEIIRDQRKKINLIGSYTMFRFLDEAILRKKINRKIADRIHWREYKDLVLNPSKVVPVLEKRKYATVVWDGHNDYFSENIALKESSGVDSNILEIKGTPASLGVVIGKVKIILNSGEFSKLEKGEILVTEMTRPDYISVMKFAGAIITDEGGLTCHAAIISRELGIPCVIGTKIATRILKDGDLVEVNANHGVIKIIK